MRRPLFGLALLGGLAACDGLGEPNPEQQARAQAAARSACVHAELASNGRLALRQMQQMMGASESGTAAAVQQYARAYSEFAELRATATAYVDSALNYAGEPEDSVRYVELANRYVPNPPEAGTLEANIARAHAHDLRVIAADTAHPCNQLES